MEEARETPIARLYVTEKSHHLKIGMGKTCKLKKNNNNNKKKSKKKNNNNKIK